MFLTPAKETWVSKKAADKAARLDPQSVKNICVIKHAALGDLVHTRPMLIALRKEFPNAKITLGVISHYMLGIPEDLIDEIHVTKGKGHTTSEKWQSLHSLPPQDIIFDISATSYSMWLSLFTEATLKIGYIHKGLHRLAFDIAIPRAHYRFEAETFAEQLHVLGLDFDWPMIYNMPKVEPHPEISSDKPYFVYFATASTADKTWPEENFVRLIKYGIEQHPEVNHILLVGLAEWEIEAAERIRLKVNMPQLQLVQGGEMTKNVIANAKLLVSCDTGIRNLAIACETPTLGIFPLSATVYGYRPYFGPHVIARTLNDEPAHYNEVQNGFDKLIDRLQAKKQ